MPTFKPLIMNVIALLSLVFVSLLPITVNALSSEMFGAISPEQNICQGSGGTWSEGVCTTPGNDRTVSGTLRNIVNILLMLIGAIAVIMIVIGGIRYVVSGGDQSAVTSAKNTILYAVVGLIIAGASYAIVNFVIKAT